MNAKETKIAEFDGLPCTELKKQFLCDIMELTKEERIALWKELQQCGIIKN